MINWAALGLVGVVSLAVAVAVVVLVALAIVGLSPASTRQPVRRPDASARPRVPRWPGSACWPPR